MTALGRLKRTPVDLDVLDDQQTRRRRIAVNLAALLQASLPTGFDATVGVVWSLPLGQVLQLDLVVHDRLDATRQLQLPPVLCVSLDAGQDEASQRRRKICAALGVDHYWNLNPEDAKLRIFVRTRDHFRHAETATLASDTSRTWVDFGVGVVDLSMGALLRQPGPGAE